MICNWCNKKITVSPFVEKKWSVIDETELYHTRCFVIAHRALLDNTPDEFRDRLLEKPESRAIQGI